MGNVPIKTSTLFGIIHINTIHFFNVQKCSSSWKFNMHLAIGSFISKNDSDGSENGKKKQCSGLKFNNNFSSPKEKTINKQTERMFAGTAVANCSVHFLAVAAQVQRETFGTFYLSGKLSTYPTPKPTFCLKWEVSINVGLGEGEVDSFPER